MSRYSCITVCATVNAVFASFPNKGYAVSAKISYENISFHLRSVTPPPSSPLFYSEAPEVVNPSSQQVIYRGVGVVKNTADTVRPTNPGSPATLCHTLRIVIPDLVGDPLSCHPRPDRGSNVLSSPTRSGIHCPVIPDLIGDPEKMDSHLRGNDNEDGFPLSWE